MRSNAHNFHLTHWGRVTHMYVKKLTIIGSVNGLLLSRHQAIIWTSARILLIRTLGRNLNEIFSEIHTFSLKKMHMKMSSAKWWPSCPGLNVLKQAPHTSCCKFPVFHRREVRNGTFCWIPLSSLNCTDPCCSKYYIFPPDTQICAKLDFSNAGP